MEVLKIYLNNGEVYQVNQEGDFLVNGKASGQWGFVGAVYRSNAFRPKYTYFEIWDNPELAKNGYIIDLDHGTYRKWQGKNRRITCCVKTNL